jgi:hypothetical protein
LTSFASRTLCLPRVLSNPHLSTRKLCACSFVCEVSGISAPIHPLLKRHADERPEVVDDALKYLVFLVDADVLFDVALGMYDFGLVLLVAQLAKKVPVSSPIVFHVLIK